MKKFIITSAIILTIAAGAAVFAACGNQNNNSPDLTSNLLAFSTASSGAILESIQNNSSDVNDIVENEGNSTTPTDPTTPTTPTTPSTDNTTTDPNADKLATVKNYIALAENFLGSNPMSIIEQASDVAEYTTKMVVKVTGINGTAYEYVLYYNQTAVRSDDINEENYRINGLLVLNGHQYVVTGEKETEGSESEFSIIAKVDNRNYVKISYEQDRNEQSFEYEVVQNGVKTDIFELEIETERRETEIEMKVYSSGQTESFKFSREYENGREIIKIVSVVNNVSETYKVRVEKNADGTEDYVFISGGTEVRYDRPDFDIDDDDDDDDWDD